MPKSGNNDVDWPKAIVGNRFVKELEDDSLHCTAIQCFGSTTDGATIRLSE